MKNRWDLFMMPCNCAFQYESGINDVRKEMTSLIIKKDNNKDDFRKGWNACIIELSKKIRIENVKFKK